MNLIEYLFPRQCIFCSRVGYDICPSCFKSLITTLPSCFVCRKLSHNSWSHDKCSDIHIQYFTGWYMSKELEKIVEKKRISGVYSLHEYLFKILINKLNMEEELLNSEIYPLLSENGPTQKINIHLTKSIKNRHLSNNEIFLIGESLPKNFSMQQRGPLLKKSSHITILCLFEPIQLKDSHRCH